MKIAIPKNEETINKHFGKSESFLIIEVENQETKEIKEISTETLQHNHGGLAQLLVSEGVSLVIVGGIGKGALDALKENGLEIIRGASGKIYDIIQAYLKGELNDKDIVCNHDHGSYIHNITRLNK